MLAGCGDDGSGPASVPDIKGVYAVTYEYDLSVQSPQIGVFQLSGSCSGSFNIANQTDRSFSGSFQLEGGCDLNPTTGVFDGTISALNTVTIEDLYEVAFAVDESQCTQVSGSTTLTGRRLGDGSLSASASAAFRCTSPGDTVDAQASLQSTATR